MFSMFLYLEGEKHQEIFIQKMVSNVPTNFDILPFNVAKTYLDQLRRQLNSTYKPLKFNVVKKVDGNIIGRSSFIDKSWQGGYYKPQPDIKYFNDKHIDYFYHDRCIIDYNPFWIDFAGRNGLKYYFTYDKRFLKDNIILKDATLEDIAMFFGKKRSQLRKDKTLKILPSKKSKKYFPHPHKSLYEENKYAFDKISSRENLISFLENLI